MKKIILKILIILWMVLIFMLSNQPADDSTKLSDGVLQKTIGNVYKIVNGNFTNDDLINVKEKYTMIVRKSAHFTLYFILGILAISLLNECDCKNALIYAFLICFCYAISDEIHQLFVSGRSAELRDVLIDSSGGLLGILIIYFSRKKLR